MMVKYNLNVEALYAEQNTLLEPNNFIPSWEAGDEEKKEVSSALRKLRLNYDQIHQKVMDKDAALELLRVSQKMILRMNNFANKTKMIHVTNFTLFALIERR